MTSLCQGIVTGLYYGAMFGLSSKLMFRREIYKIHKFSGRIVFGNIAYGALGFATFSGIFSGTSCHLSRIFPNDKVKPFVKGVSGFSSTFALAYYESRCAYAAGRASAVVGIGITIAAYMYPLLGSQFR